MGCHTWFSRPATIIEVLTLMKSAREELEKRWKEEEKYRIGDDIVEYPDYEGAYCLSKEEYEFLKQQIKNKNLYVINDYGDLGKTRLIDYMIYIDLSQPNDKLERYKIPELFYDNFRVEGYPDWKIYSTRQLRRKMGKKWYNLTKEQIEDIHRFFKLYPGGVITFG